MKKKIVAIVLCVAMLAIAVVGGTLAYFTDEGEQTNTFTMGKVDIELTEPNYEGDENNELHIFPGQSYTKDPTITVASDSEDCWLIATVTISNLADLNKLYEDDQTGVKQPWGLSLAGNGKMVSGSIADWTAVPATENGVSGTLLDGRVFLTYEEDAANDNIIYTFYFKEIHKAGAEEVLFTQVNIPSIIDNGDITSDLTVAVKAYAIQAVGFENVYEAYEAILEQGD